MKAYLIAINSKYIHPAMGVFSIVANSNYPIIYDEFTIKDKKEKIINAIFNNQYDVLGFSVYIWNSLIVKEIIQEIKDKGFKKPIFIGGPEGYFNSEIFIDNYGVDYVISNEGEESFNELMEHLDNQISINEVSNLYYKSDDKIKYTYTKLPDINKVKHDLSLIKDFKHRVAYLESSRGCPFKCSYCMASLEDKVRFFPIDKVKSEIKYLLDNNCKTIKFLDRSFNINKTYMLDILKFINENDNNISVFQFEIVGDLLEREIIDYIKDNMRKGILRFEIGVQSTNDETTKAVCRRQNFEKLKENIKLLNDHVTIHLDLIAGLPYEDLNSFKKSFNDTYLLMGEELQLGFLKELKGTKISKEKQEHNYKFDDTPPYEIIDNKYINNDELKTIHIVEQGLEKYHNKGCFKRTMEYLFLKEKLNPFDTFLELSNKSVVELKFLNDDAAYKHLYDTLKDKVDENELLDNIKLDYLLKNKIKPKIWWDYKLKKEDIKKYFEIFNSRYGIDMITFYNYSHLELINDTPVLVIYKDSRVEIMNL